MFYGACLGDQNRLRLEYDDQDAKVVEWLDGIVRCFL